MEFSFEALDDTSSRKDTGADTVQAAWAGAARMRNVELTESATTEFIYSVKKGTI